MPNRLSGTEVSGTGSANTTVGHDRGASLDDAGREDDAGDHHQEDEQSVARSTSDIGEPLGSGITATTRTEGAPVLTSTSREIILEHSERTLLRDKEDVQEGINDNGADKVAIDSPPRSRSPKWGMPRMPGLKNTLNATLGRATNLITKGESTSNGRSEDTAPQTENVQVVDELQSILEDVPDPQVRHGKPPPDTRAPQDKKQASRGAMQGIQLMKASLQARLRGVSISEKLFAENENILSEEGERTEAEGSNHEECSSVGSGTPLVVFNSNGAEPNGAMKKPDKPNFSEEQPITQENTQNPSSNDTNVPVASSTDGDVRFERRYSSPLKSLLQDAAGHAHENVEEKQNNEGNIEGYEVATDTIGDEYHAKGPVAQAVSALDTAISAARLKSKLSSPSLAATLKGFGWNKAKTEAIASVTSPPSASMGSPVGIIPSTGSAGEEGASAPTTHEHTGGDGTNDPNNLASTVRVAVFRASNLPERLGIKFGRQKKNSTLGRFVRLKLCGVSASTPIVQGQGAECRWGTKQEGYLLEIVVPPGNLPAAGVGSSKIMIEVWNKASEELGKDVLMGKTEILVAEWLGKKGWASLDPKQSQGGRVKLRVALKPCRKLDGSDDVAMQDRGASDSEERPVHVEVNPTSPGPDATNTLQQVEEEQQQGETAAKTTVPIPERGEKYSERLPLVAGSFPKEDQENDFTVSADRILGEQTMAATLNVGASDGQMVQEIDTGNSDTHQDGGAALSASEDLVQACVASAANDKSSEEEEVSPAVPEKAPNDPSSNALDGLSTLENHARETEVNRREDVLHNVLLVVRQDEFNTAPHNEVLGEQEAEVRGTHMDSLPIMLAPMELQANGHTPGVGDSSEFPDGDSADVDVEKEDRNGQLSSDARDKLAALDLTGGPATDSDVATTAVTSKSAVLTIPPRETLESSGHGSYALSQTEPATHEQHDSDGKSHEQDPRQEIDTRPRRNTVKLQSDGGNGEGTASEMLATMLRETPSKQMKSALPRGVQLQDHVSIGSNRARKRIERAREILRRRRAVVSSSGSDRDRWSAPCGRQMVTSPQTPAATAIQSGFRGWIARRRLRLWQRLAVRIQAVYRGHTKRREFIALTVRARRAKGEEERARSRRSRMMYITQELNLLLKTPAEHCLRMDELRAEASARHIQRVWRCHSQKYSCPSTGGSVRDSARPTGLGKPFFTAPEISSRSDHIPTSDITLEALGRRVASRQRAKEHLRDTEKERSGGVANNIAQDGAWRLTAAFNQSHTGRYSAAKRRSTRLANFRKLQDQLLRPPKLNSTGTTSVSAKPSEGSRRHRMVMDTAVDKSWYETEDPAQRDRAQRAHKLSLATAKDRGIKSWATSLPSDVGGYDDLLDIRRLVPAWPTHTVGGRGALDFVDGFIRNQHTSGDGGSGTGDRKFDSDEASLWWYVYSTNGAQTSGLHQEQDGVFVELLERAKTTLKRRKEHAERDEQQHQLMVARKRQIIIDKMIHRRKVASCPSLSCLQQRVTLAQRRAAGTIQAFIRGCLERKQVSLLRAEARVFGALQVLLTELRQPELEAEDTTRPLQTLGVILADHSIPTCRSSSPRRLLRMRDE
ncbi:unnamed protein product [Ectocarpus sp. 4 AP-2014]